MASKLLEFQTKQRQLKQLQEEIEAMKSSPELEHDLAFKRELDALMETFSKSPKDIIALLAPQENKPEAPQKSAKPRKLKRYRNPHTGEVIETRGGNHKTLKAWKQDHGAEAVESWLEETEAA